MMRAYDIVEDIYGYANELGEWGEDEGTVTLNIESNGELFHLFSGEAHYEGNRQGQWANISVPGGASYEECFTLARRLIDSALADASCWQ